MVCYSTGVRIRGGEGRKKRKTIQFLFLRLKVVGGGGWTRKRTEQWGKMEDQQMFQRVRAVTERPLALQLVPKIDD